MKEASERQLVKDSRYPPSRVVKMFSRLGMYRHQHSMRFLVQEGRVIAADFEPFVVLTT